MKNDLEARTKRFALEVITFVANLPRRRAAWLMGDQLLRAGTSVGAVYREAARAESRKDFIHKLGVVEKELAETLYWLELLIESHLADTSVAHDLHREADELLRIVVASLRTAKRGLPPRK